jgi:hypothetical protein
MMPLFGVYDEAMSYYGEFDQFLTGLGADKQERTVYHSQEYIRNAW